MFNMEDLKKTIKEKMNKTVEVLIKELATVRTGRANANILDGVKVEYYGFPTALNEIAQISTPEPRVIMIKPYERESLGMIEKAISSSGIGLVPNNDGTVIRLNIPALTEERRKEFCKVVHKYSETAKVSVRNIRRDANDLLKKNKEVTEDQRKRGEQEVQKITDEIIKKIDEVSKAKEKDIMAI